MMGLELHRKHEMPSDGIARPCHLSAKKPPGWYLRDDITNFPDVFHFCWLVEYKYFLLCWDTPWPEFVPNFVNQF